MSTNQKWLFALNLLIFFKKRFVNFGKWGKWRLDLFVFSQNSKNEGNYPKTSFFSKKKNLKFCCSQKKKKVLKQIKKTCIIVKTKFFYNFTVKTKTSILNLKRFHGGFFELKILSIFITAFLLKFIIWTFFFQVL